MRKTFALLFALAAGSAQAYQPEPGLWWNPNESGSGFTIELQDNLLVFTGYLGETNGLPVWYTSAGFLNGNALYEGDLLRFTNSQCAGCSYSGPPQNQRVGTLRLAFDALRGIGRNLARQPADAVVHGHLGQARSDVESLNHGQCLPFLDLE